MISKALLQETNVAFVQKAHFAKRGQLPVTKITAKVGFIVQLGLGMLLSFLALAVHTHMKTPMLNLKTNALIVSRDTTVERELASLHLAHNTPSAPLTVHSILTASLVLLELMKKERLSLTVRFVILDTCAQEELALSNVPLVFI